METKRIEVLTPSEVARLLRVKVRTVQLLAADGRLPGFRVGKHWRFSRNRIEEYMNPAPAVLIDPPRQDTESPDALYERLLAYEKRGKKHCN